MSMNFKGITFLFLFGIMVLLAALPVCADVSFARDIAPILLKRCTGCHGERANLGGYRVHTFQNLMKVGVSGKAAVVPGRPEDSRLYLLITAKAEAVRMPRSDDPLSPAQISLIRTWIAEGARFDGGDASAALKSLLGVRRHPLAPDSYRAPVPIMALAFAPGGKEVYVGGYNEITVWNAANGALVRRIQHLPQRIQALAFSKDGRFLLVGGGTPGEYGEAALVDAGTGERVKVLDTFNDIVLSAVFSQDGTHIAAGGADNSVRVYDSGTGNRLWISNVHSDWVTSLSFSSDGKYVASAGKDMTVKVNDAKTGELFTTYNGHNRQIGQYKGQAPVYAVQFAPDTLLAYSAGGGRWIQIWDPIRTKAEAGDAGDMEERFAKQSHAKYLDHGFHGPVYALSLKAGQLFAASADGVLKQFDLGSFKEVHAYKAGSEWLFGLDYDPAANRVAVGSFNGEVWIWDTTTGQPAVVFQAQPGLTGR